MREIAHIRATMLGRFALQQTGMKEPRMVSLAGRSGRLWTLVAYAAFVLPQMATISAGFALVLVLDMVLLLTLGSYFWMQNALFYGSIFQKSSNCIRMFFGFLPQTALSAIVQVGYWLLIAFLIPRCAFMFLLTGLWVPSLLAAFSVYSTMEKNLHLEERIQDIKNY